MSKWLSMLRTPSGRRPTADVVAAVQAAFDGCEQALINYVALSPYARGPGAQAPREPEPRDYHIQPGWMQIPNPRRPGPGEVRRARRGRPASP